MAKSDKKRFLGLPRLQAGKRSGKRGNIAQTLRQRELSRVSGRFSFFRSQALYRLYSVVPARYRWLLPMLRDSLPGVAEAEETETEAAAIAAEAEVLAAPLVDTLPLPPLPPGTKLLGQLGSYRVEAQIGVRGRGRVYRGWRMGSEQPVSLREYLLPPQQFSQAEIRQRQAGFRDRGGLALADGRPERFRLIQPQDAIPDQQEPRCYLVGFSGLDLLPSLRSHLEQRPQPWGAPQVWRFFNQILQTLESLHGQKYVVPAGQVRPGLVHGNLSFDSVLIDWPDDPALAGDPQFLSYLTDLQLWENLFTPPQDSLPSMTVADDLTAVGQIGYQLLPGAAIAEAEGRDPRQPQDWSAEVQPQLRDFTYRLLGLRTPFASAEAARRAIPRDWQLLATTPIADDSTELEETSRPRWWRWLVAALLLVLLGGALGWWLTRRRLAIASPDGPPQLCCFAEAVGVPRGRFTYAGENDSLGAYVLRQKNLVFPDMTVEGAIEAAYPEVALAYQPLATDEAAIGAVLDEEADFALSALFGSSAGAVLPLPPTVQSTPVAHDAIAVFVAFSYAERAQGLPLGLKGRLTFEQLRQLYTGQIVNWRTLGGPDLPVQLYIPSEPDLVAIFERQVLQDPTAIATFRSLLEPPATITSEVSSDRPPVKVLRTFEILRGVMQDFEAEAIGSIGFGPLSQVFGQCSVYPLALQAEDGEFVQAIADGQTGRAIDPTIDLCQDKGSYRRDYTAILTGHYPLAYPLEVIFPYDNSRPPMGRKVAEILQSQESQLLLERAGLVPIAEPEPTPPRRQN